MNSKTATEQAFEDAYEAGKSSALALLASGKPVLMVDEMGLSDSEFANARGWNSVFASPENGKLLKKTMDSNKRTNGLFAVDVGGGVQHMIIAGGESRSVLESFTQAEVNQMMDWLAAQQQSGGAASIADWPGWRQVGERMQNDIGRAGEITRALLARIAATRNL